MGGPAAAPASALGPGTCWREWRDGPAVVDREQIGYWAAAYRESEWRARRRADVSTAIHVVTERQGFFTPKTLAAYLALSERTVRQLLADSAIPSYRIAGSRRIDPRDVDNYLRRCRDGRTLAS